MKKLITMLALLVTASLAFPAAAAAPTVSLGNAVLEVAAGQTAPLSVAVTDVQDLYGLEIHLRFDPAVVQVTDADPGKDGIQVAAGDFLSADFVAQNQANNEAGSIDYAVTQVNPKEPRSGSGTLLVIQFQGSAAGRASQLEVTSGILTTRDGDVLPVTFTSGEVRVKGASAAGQTPTPSPTSRRETAAPTLSPTPQPAVGGDAPTATRALTNTPVAVGAESTPSVQPARERTATATTPAPTRTALPAAGTPAQRAEAAVATATAAPTAAPAAAAPTPTPAETAQAAHAMAAQTPLPAASETPAPRPTPETGRPTPALLARAAPANAARPVLDSSASAAPGKVERTATGQPVTSALLIGACVLLGLAVLVAAIMLWLSLRRRQA